MRDGWEIRKLGDVCTKITDGSHNPPKGIAHSDFAMISSQNVYNDKISFDGVRYLQEEDFKNEDKRTSVRKGDVLLTIVGTVGRCAVFSVDRRITLQRSVAVLRPQNYLKPRFLMHCLISKSVWLNEEAHGIAQKGLYLKQLAKVSIPVPPIAEQELIVAELDCLTGIIEKKKQQLEELDKLAQSIFYDMFGDPITNEKGWEMKKLKDVAEIVGGSTPKTNVEEYWNGQNPWVAPAELHQNHYISSTERGISNEAAKGLPLLPVGTVLLSSRAPIGKVSITTIPMYCNQGFKNVVCSNALNNEYVYHLLLNKTEYLNSLGTGATFKEISKKTTENIAIAVPPIDLQEAFAAQSRAIEKQKELVKRSIVDAEMLFNSRMDYWFN